MNILISGDLFVSGTFDPDDLVSQNLQRIFNLSDLNIVNFEGPVADDTVNSKIEKTGPYLKNNPGVFTIMKKLNIQLVTLANNHIMDYGTPGLLNTLSICKEKSVHHVGAGMSLEEAQKPYLLEKDFTKISILNFTENEWSCASKDNPGTNPLNIVENVRQIRKAKEISDYVLVIIHGGHELYDLPSPRMVSQYRFYAENGASIIIGHHSHCISGFEVFKGVPVFYGLGNFLSIRESKPDSWYTGLILSLKIEQNTKIKWDLIPIRQDRNTHTLSDLEGDERQKVISDIGRNSLIISDEALLSKSWYNFVNEKYDWIMDIFSPVQLINNRFLLGALKKTGLNRFFIKKNHYKKILNHIRCESHSDLSKSVIEKYLKANENRNP